MLTKEEIKTANPVKLQEELAETRVKLAETKLKVTVGQSKANHEVGILKSHVARILTRLNEKKLEKKPE